MSTFITERNDIAWRKKKCQLRSIKINVIVKIRQLDIILPFFLSAIFFFNCGEGEGGSCMLQSSILAFSESLMLSMNNYGHYGAKVLCQVILFSGTSLISHC